MCDLNNILTPNHKNTSFNILSSNLIFNVSNIKKYKNKACKYFTFTSPVSNNRLVFFSLRQPRAFFTNRIF